MTNLRRDEIAVASPVPLETGVKGGGNQGLNTGKYLLDGMLWTLGDRDRFKYEIGLTIKGIIRKDNSGSDTEKDDPSLRPVKVALNVEKNRDGKIGKTHLYFDYPRSRFLTVEEYREEYEKITEI